MAENLHGHPRFYKIIEELKVRHSSKSHDYNREDPLANLKMCEQIFIPCSKCKHLNYIPAWVGVAIRRMDKWSREVSLISKNPEVGGELYTETLGDDAVYAILQQILYEEWIAKK